MNAFTALFEALDQTNKTQQKISILAEYFKQASNEDKIWAIALFLGRRPPRIASSKQLRNWAAITSGLPMWLVEATWHTVGDLGETLAGIIPYEKEGEGINLSLSELINQIIAIKKISGEEEKLRVISTLWKNMTQSERFIFNKLLGGNFRVGVSKGVLIKALSRAFELDEKIVAHRLMGDWNPTEVNFDALLLQPSFEDQLSKPYPFFLAYALEDAQHIKQELPLWLAEHKWDGIRAQIILRNKRLYVWTRGEELVTDRYPEFSELPKHLPDGVVMDGEILAWQQDKPMPFQYLQKRIGRKQLTKKLLQEIPVIFMAYDLLEYQGNDIRLQSLLYRKEKLHHLIGQCNLPCIKISEYFTFNSWIEAEQKRNTCYETGSEGLMLKHKNSIYDVGRKKGAWWKWKIEPFTIDAVMIYAQSGHGRRAGLYTDYTFAVWDEQGKLVPITKAYSGLTDDEILKLDRWIKQHTIEKFGPVRSVEPVQVFEIAFEGIQKSTRHKSGVAFRFPRIVRWRTDKRADEADKLADIKSLIR